MLNYLIYDKSRVAEGQGLRPQQDPLVVLHHLQYFFYMHGSALSIKRRLDRGSAGPSLSPAYTIVVLLTRYVQTVSSTLTICMYQFKLRQ